MGKIQTDLHFWIQTLHQGRFMSACICGLFTIETIKGLTGVSVMNDYSDDKIYEVDFESYDDANKFAKANAFEELDASIINPSNIKHKKKSFRMKLKTKEMKKK